MTLPTRDWRERNQIPWCLVAAYAILGLFIVIEARLHQGEEAKTLNAGIADAGTTQLIAVSFATALIGTPLLSRLGIGRTALPGIVGLTMMVAGLGLRVWAALVLGRYYTRTLRVAGDQTVVHNGPYRLVRHPGYLGVLLMWIGFGLATAMVAAMMAYVYNQRIRSEEAMLLRSLGESYRTYMRGTWRLIPGVY